MNNWDEQTFASQLLMRTQRHVALLATVWHQLPLNELLERLDELLFTKTWVQQKKDFMKCSQNMGMLVNQLAEKITKAGMLAFGEAWSPQ